MDQQKLQQIVTLDPGDLELKFAFDHVTGAYKAEIGITNNSQDRGNVAFKVKTTAPQAYIVKPNQGLIEYGKTLAVALQMQGSPSDMKISEQKFLVQAAPCTLHVKEIYALPTFWNDAQQNRVPTASFKLRINIVKADSPPPSAAAAPPFLSTTERFTFNSQQQQHPTSTSYINSALKELQTMSPSVVEQSSLSPEFPTINRPVALKQQQQVQFLFDNNDDSDITLREGAGVNKSGNTSTHQRHSRVLQSNVTATSAADDENITKKNDELRKQLELISQEKTKVQSEIRELLQKQIDTHHLDQAKVKELYEWQQPDLGKDSRFQIIHLLITALIGLFIGGYLAKSSNIL